MSACSEGRRGWFLPWTVAFGVMLGVGSPAQAESDEGAAGMAGAPRRAGAITALVRGLRRRGWRIRRRRLIAVRSVVEP
jgi:hypothetical protein